MSKPADLVCFTRDEVTKIQIFKVRCRSKIAELRAEKSHTKQTLATRYEGEIKQCKIRLQACYKQASIKQTCPSCLQPAIVVGVLAGVSGIVVGIVVTIAAYSAIK